MVDARVVKQGARHESNTKEVQRGDADMQKRKLQRVNAANDALGRAKQSSGSDQDIAQREAGRPARVRLKARRKNQVKLSQDNAAPGVAQEGVSINRQTPLRLSGEVEEEPDPAGEVGQVQPDFTVCLEGVRKQMISSERAALEPKERTKGRKRKGSGGGLPMGDDGDMEKAKGGETAKQSSAGKADREIAGLPSGAKRLKPVPARKKAVGTANPMPAAAILPMVSQATELAKPSSNAKVTTGE